MAGDPANVHLWIEADVLVYPGPTLPTGDIPADITAPWVTTTGKWGYFGLLVGDDGIDIQRQWDETDIPAWGYGTIIVASKNFKSNGKVSAREENPSCSRCCGPAPPTPRTWCRSRRICSSASRSAARTARFVG
jgi:hypothetical protein